MERAFKPFMEGRIPPQNHNILLVVKNYPRLKKRGVSKVRDKINYMIKKLKVKDTHHA